MCNGGICLEIQIKYKHHMRVKLLFNPNSGANDKSPTQLMDVIKEMQAWRFVCEPFMIEPHCDLYKVVDEAIASGIKMIVVCGGDGTVSSAARAMIGKKAIFGIIPTGTRNNIALSLGIPRDISGAIAILRTGRRMKVDIGTSTVDNISTPFIELCSVGLFSALFSAADDIQHGKITRIGDFLATLTTSPPSEIRLILENKEEIRRVGHIVLVSNMPYVGTNYQISSLDSYHDGLLDVILFADLTKLDLIGYVLKGIDANKQEDPRIQRFRVQRIVVDTHPAMPIMADGVAIGEGAVIIEVQRQALTVMVEAQVSPKLGEENEK